MKVNKTYVSNSVCRRVLEALRQFEFGAKKAQLADELESENISYGTLHYALMALLQDGQIIRKRNGKKTRGRNNYYVYRVKEVNV